MDPINPWIDPTETRRMAERLMRPAREPVASPDEAGFDDSFVGFSNDPVGEGDAPPAGFAEPEIPSGATSAGQPSPFPESTAWLRAAHAATGSFMFDPKGDMVFDDGGNGAFHFIARDLANAGAPAHNIRVKISAESVLEVIPIESEGGCSWLAVMVSSALSPDAIIQIRKHWLSAS